MDHYPRQVPLDYTIFDECRNVWISRSMIKRYTRSKISMRFTQVTHSRGHLFVADSVGNMHDTLFDMSCSSRFSSVLYAHGAGLRGHDIYLANTAFVLPYYGDAARRVLSSEDDDEVLLETRLSLW